MNDLHICSFGTDVSDLRGKNLTYENVKALVLKAGRFSIWDAGATAKHARLFTELENDLDIETDRESLGFPWIQVKKRDKPLCAKCRGRGVVERYEPINSRNCWVRHEPCDCVSASAPSVPADSEDR